MQPYPDENSRHITRDSCRIATSKAGWILWKGDIMCRPEQRNAIWKLLSTRTIKVIIPTWYKEGKNEMMASHDSSDV